MERGRWRVHVCGYCVFARMGAAGVAAVYARVRQWVAMYRLGGWGWRVGLVCAMGR